MIMKNMKNYKHKIVDCGWDDERHYSKQSKKLLLAYVVVSNELIGHIVFDGMRRDNRLDALNTLRYLFLNR